MWVKDKSSRSICLSQNITNSVEEEWIYLTSKNFTRRNFLPICILPPSYFDWQRSIWGIFGRMCNWCGRSGVAGAVEGTKDKAMQAAIIYINYRPRSVHVQNYITLTSNEQTRWYPLGIQKLVSTYDLPDYRPEFQFSGAGGILGKSKLKKYSKCQDLPKFQFGGYSGQVKTENTQSATICLNFNFQGGGGRYTLGKSKLKILKVPRSA